jgi:hypothetical protein
MVLAHLHANIIQASKMPVQLYQECFHIFIEAPSISIEYQYQPLNPNKNEIRVLTLLPYHHSSHGPNSVVRCTLENVPLEPRTRRRNLRSNPVQLGFGRYWDNKFAGKAETASSLVMTALDEDANDALGLKKGKRPF